VEHNRPTNSPTEHDERRTTPPVLLVCISDAARVLGIGRTTFYKLIEDGDIHVVHIGRAVRVPVTELDAFVTRLNKQVTK